MQIRPVYFGQNTPKMTPPPKRQPGETDAQFRERLAEWAKSVGGKPSGSKTGH